MYKETASLVKVYLHPTNNKVILSYQEPVNKSMSNHRENLFIQLRELYLLL